MNDAIVMGEVLEHVENPKPFLNKIYELAKDDAFVFITTCLNAPQLGEQFLTELFNDELPQARFVERLSNRQDFPEVDLQRNLKMLHYRI